MEEPDVATDAPTLYARVTDSSGDDLEYDRFYQQAGRLSDGVYECAPPHTENPEQWTYLCVHNGQQHPLSNPYSTIPTKDDQTLAQFTHLVYRNLEAQAARFSAGELTP